jgi:hypothetical protein
MTLEEAENLKAGDIIRIPGNTNRRFYVCILIEGKIPKTHTKQFQAYKSSILWYEDSSGRSYPEGECPFYFDTWKKKPSIITGHIPYYKYFTGRFNCNISPVSEPPQRQNPTRKDAIIEFRFAEIPK